MLNKILTSVIIFLTPFISLSLPAQGTSADSIPPSTIPTQRISNEISWSIPKSPIDSIGQIYLQKLSQLSKQFETYQYTQADTLANPYYFYIFAQPTYYSHPVRIAIGKLPQEQKISKIEEPYVKATIITPAEFLGNVIKLIQNRRGIQDKMEYITQDRVLLSYSIPTNEIIMDFYDKLKSSTKGYASFDYEPIGYKEGDLIKLDIKVAGEVVDALSIIVARQKAYEKGKNLVGMMKDIIPRQLFEVAIQASIGNKVIARETIKSMGKNVTAKCYGGDITRKRKLLEKQKEGKKRLKAIGKVELPQDTFLAVLKID